MSQPLKYAVFGSGSWATAIVKMLCENLEEVGWYMRSVYAIEHIKKEQHNPNYLSSVEFDIHKLKLSDDINEMVTYADYLIFVIPSAFVETELQKLTNPLEGKIIFSAIKGIVPESSLIVGDHFYTNYNIPFKDIGVESSLLLFNVLKRRLCNRACVSSMVIYLLTIIIPHFQSIISNREIRDP